MILGMQPGSAMFTKHADITYTVIVGFALANILMGIIGLLIARYVVKVTQVPTSVLCPIIVVLAVVGSYALSSTMYNVYVMIVFGLLGYFMRKADYPASATVLGLILGSMAETGLRQSVAMSRGNVLAYFFSRPLSIALMVLILVCGFYPTFKEHRKKKQQAQ